MQWMLTHPLSTVVSLLLLWLSLGGASAEQSEEELQPTVTPADGTEGASSICSQLFDNIGSFCQHVILPSESESGVCQPEFSMETCNHCQDMVQLCGYPDDRDLGRICLSDLAPSCAVANLNEDDGSLFIEDFCSVVQSVCSNGFGSGIASSGSGSGVSSGSSGSGVEPTDVPTTGSPPGPTTTASEPTTNVPISTTTMGTAATTLPTIPTTTSTDTSGTLMATTINIPTLVPTVLVRLEDLTEQQRENLVTVRFTGLSEEQFLDNAITAFRMEIATMVNEFLLNQDQQRKKRQVPPIQVSLDDVLVIQPLRIVNDQLLVSFVVGGQEGQSAPVSGADVASLLQAEGPSLAMTLSNVSGQPVQFVDAFATTTTTTTTTDTTTTIGTSQIPTTRPPVPPPREQPEREQVQQLSSGAIAGIVISVVLVVVLVVAAVVVAIVALALGYRNSGGTKLKWRRSHSHSLPESYVTVLRNDADSPSDSHLMSEWQPMPKSEGNEYIDVPSTEENGGTHEHTAL